MKGGRQRIEFEGVSAQIRPETVSLAAADIAIVEQNFDFDLLTPAKLMEKAVGGEVTIVRVNPATGAETREQAEVLATNGGVVLKIGQRIEVLRDDGLPVRVIFDKVPDNLRARPTLSVTIDSARAGTRTASLSYLTPGLGWKADYVALYDESAGKIDVQGWITLTNTSGTTYENAQTLLVAGSPSQVRADQIRLIGLAPVRRVRRPTTLEQAGTESGSRERLGDFYLYPLPERTTIANLQTKQVGFLDVHGVPAEHGYEFRNHWLGTSDQPRSAKSTYRFSTSAHAGLGDQLPAGILRFYLRDQRGEPQFIGESRIDHTPMGSTLSLATGDAFDVKVQAVVDKRTRVNEHDWKTDMRYELSNASARPVTVDFASRRPVGRLAHHRGEPEEHAAKRGHGRMEREHSGERQDRADRQLRHPVLASDRPMAPRLSGWNFFSSGAAGVSGAAIALLLASTQSKSQSPVLDARAGRPARYPSPFTAIPTALRDRSISIASPALP